MRRRSAGYCPSLAAAWSVQRGGAAATAGRRRGRGGCPGPSFIAGATNDIGRAIAFHRVASGPGLVLFDRNPDKLAAVGGLASCQTGGAQGEHPGTRDGGVLVNTADVSYPYA
ncbi:hypothetical protein QYE76_053362 [Lolium multiflorum]|uniref:Uncharacterized protein n=1 Tax=Lolium multiflorum TaxID=4521 RepID=A0AAD8SVK3_LOLMU|nr:hypothetical protein QYE76_053362 [Lolium multiflorum]